MPILSPARNSRPKQRGFTLIELMVTLTVAGVLLALGVPSFVQLIANNRIANQTNEFVGALAMARTEAVRRSQPVSLRSQDGTGTLEFAKGWKIFTDADADGAPATTVTATDGTVIRESSGVVGRTTLKRVTCTVASGVYTCADSAATDRMFVVFNARGGNNGAITYFKVCDAGTSSVKGRIVQLSTMGRVSLVSSTASCP